MTKHTGVPTGCIGSGYEALRYEPPQRRPKETVVFERPSPAQLGVTSLAAAFTRDGEANNSEDGDQGTYINTHNTATNHAGPSKNSTTTRNMLKFINRNLRGKDREQSAASTYELPLGWSFYTDPASQRLHYIDHPTGRTYDNPPPPRFKFDPNRTPSPREFDIWSQSSSSSISSLDLGTPLIFTKTTTVSAVSEPAPEDSPTGTPTLHARLQKRTEYNNITPTPSSSTKSQEPEHLYTLTTTHTISIPSNTNPNPCCCKNHTSSPSPCPQKTCCDRTIDQPLVPCGYAGDETERELRWRGIKLSCRSQKFYAERQCPVCEKWTLECEHDRVGDLRSSVRVPRLKYRNMDTGAGAGAGEEGEGGGGKLGGRGKGKERMV